MKRSAKNRSIAFAILALLFSPAAIEAIPSSSTGPGGVQPPWYGQFRFRREISVVNSGPVELLNYPVLAQVTFGYAHLLSARVELRLVDEAGREVPSYVVDTRVIGDFVASALLLFFARLGPSANESFWLYYGDINAGLPQYRQQTITKNVGAGKLSVSLGSPESPSSVTIDFGSTYTESLVPRLSYGQSAQSYGSASMAANPLRIVEHWQAFGNASSQGAAIASTTLQAGSLRYSEVVVLFNSSLVLLDTLQNSGSSSLNNLSFMLIGNYTQLAQLGLETVEYNRANATVVATAAGAFFGLASRPSPTSFDVGTKSAILAEIGTGALRGTVSATGPSLAALDWSVKELAAGSFFTTEETWAVAASNSGVSILLQRYDNPPRIAEGNEEASNSYLPSANAIWHAKVNLTDLTLPISGLSVPLTIAGGIWLPETLTLDGTATYTEPSGNFSQGTNGQWRAESSASGNATAYSNSAFWSIGRNMFLGRLAVIDSNSSGVGIASLTSVSGTAYGSSEPHLIVRYRANLALVDGDPSAQRFYMALDLGSSSTGKFDRTLVFPVTGTSTGINETSCGARASVASGPLSQHVPTASLAGYLIGDGTWRTLDFNLRGWVSSSGTRFGLRFCEAAGRGFTGHLELQIERAGVRVVAPAQDLVEAVLDKTQPVIGLSVADAQVLSSSGLIANLELSFDIASSEPMTQSQGSQFKSRLPEPSLVGLSGSVAGKQSSILPLQLLGIAAYSPFDSLTPRIMVNGSSSGQPIQSNGSVFVEGGVGGFAARTPGTSSELVVAFKGVSLALKVLDADGSPVGGALLRLRGEASSSSIQAPTDSAGSAVLELVPWNYSLEVLFQGQIVSTSSLELTSNQSTTIRCNVYRVGIKINDAQGHALQGAGVLLTRGNWTERGVSDNHGLFNTQLVGNGIYQIGVEVGGGRFQGGSLTASVNDATIVVGTAYLAPIFETVIAALIVAALVILGVLLYVRGRLFRVIRGRAC